MKTFAEMLPTATAEMREFVEAYDIALVDAQKNMKAGRSYADPRAIMRSTPPAKEPVSVEGEANGEGGTFTTFFFPGESPRVKPGDRVRVVKIEETT